MSNKKHFSRRNFIGHSLIGMAGTAVLSGNPLAAFAGSTAPGKKYKLGVVGCGNRSKAIIGALNQVPDIEIAALCDIVQHKMPQRAELIKKGPKPRFYEHLDDMLKQDDLEAIAVITPPYLHKEHTIAALEAGKHVFCEKPMALTVADCNEMVRAVERTKKQLQIGTQRRHSPDYKVLVDAIRNQPVGKILYSDLNDYRGDWRVPAPDEYPPGVQYWRLNQKQSGGVIYEMGAHIIDVNNWIFDSEPVSVSSIQGVNDLALRKRDSADHGGVVVRYANGAVMNYGGVVYSYGPASPDTFFCVNGTLQFGGGQLSIHYGFPPGVPGHHGAPPKPEIRPLPRGGGVVEEMAYFAEVVAGKKKAYPDGPIGRQTVQICEGAFRSSQERKEIDISELG
ncbi:Gfo/Idh/MocA family oxidoreductase [Compostibacter hankyongensis]|uniref:Gfo/Idh/MocA family oxidoreductase n=1 Tax=Compostibacter hankyongensis TaxID=1007089 RepID=A0ABP8FJR5_9BACT